MTKKNIEPSRLAKALLESANDMRQVGILDDASYSKITMRHLRAEDKLDLQPLTGGDIRSIRKRAHLSQAVFARHLNLTTGSVSQFERGVKHAIWASCNLSRFCGGGQ
jgi:putative transcriptional regulator